MAIKSVEEMAERGIEIDLTGPQGNAFFLLGQASTLAEMKESDYEHLLEVFDREFGDFVTLYR